MPLSLPSKSTLSQMFTFVEWVREMGRIKVFARLLAVFQVPVVLICSNTNPAFQTKVAVGNAS